jgi:transposase
MGQSGKNRHTVFLFEDEMTIQLNPTLYRKWSIRGKQPEIGSWVGTRQKTHAFGAVNARTGEFISMQEDRINARNFIRFLRIIRKKYVHRNIVMILDNAGWHKARKVGRFLGDDGNFQFLFLPPYSPNLNPVEKIWKLLRYRVTHNHFFYTLKKLVTAVAGFGRGLRYEKARLVSLCLFS